MLKIPQARLQQYVNRELSVVQNGFRKGRETRNQIANIHWIIGKAKVMYEQRSNKIWLIWKKLRNPKLGSICPLGSDD